MIQSNEFRRGEGLPSERQLASDFDVSRTVVRGAIKNLTKVGLLECEPNCRPVVRFATPSAGVSKRHVGIWLWPNTSDYAAASIIKGIQEANLGSDVRLMIASAPPDDWEATFDSERKFLDSLADDPQEAGAIVWYLGGEKNRPSLDRLRSANIPIVFIDRQPPPGFSGDFVGTNNESGAQRVVQHLLELGHRRVGLITNVEAVSSVSEREVGYRRALSSAGITFDPNLVQRSSVDGAVGAESALHNLFALSDPPTAIFCINDYLALHVHEALTQRGVKVPKEVSVAGFDGLLRWIPGGGNLTTAVQDFYRIGQLAAELVIERMTDGRPEAYKHLLLDAPLAVRGSTASPTSLTDYGVLK